MARSIKWAKKPGRETLREMLAEWKAQGIHPPRTITRFTLLSLEPKGGLNRCCWCGAVLKGRSSRWCRGGKCVLEYKVMTGCQSTIRGLVEDRDKGVCAECGVDTRLVEFQFGYYKQAFMSGIPLGKEAVRSFMQAVLPWSTRDEQALYRESLDLLDSLWDKLLPGGVWPNPLPPLKAKSVYIRVIANRRFFCQGRLPHLWEADHILAVEDGGGAGCGLDNFRTLCRPCHVKRSADQAAVRAQKRRNQPIDKK